MATTAGTECDSVILESTNSSGQPSIGYTFLPKISADGRYIVFQSYADNLVAHDTNGVDVFLKNLMTGETTRVTTDSNGVEQAGVYYYNWHTPITNDGRYVAFSSSAYNLVPGDTNGAPDVYLKDLLTGVTTRLSNGQGGVEASGPSFVDDITPDGRYVLFTSGASNLVSGDSNDYYDIFVIDRITGSITRADTSGSGMEANGHAFGGNITPDGRYVSFFTYADNLVPSDDPAYDIFVKDVVTGTTTKVSTNVAGGGGNASSVDPVISADGRYVAFSSIADNLVPGDTNGTWDVFVKDLDTGNITRVSTSAAGAEAGQGASQPDISYNGQYVVFESISANLVPDDSDLLPDVFVKDVFSGAIARVSGSVGGGSTPEISADGRFIVFENHASTLATNNMTGHDLFLAANPLINDSSDTVYSSVSYTLPADIEDLALTGAAAIDGIGNTLDNVLTGNVAANLLYGDAGSDTINGGGGNDIIDGGAGIDTACFSARLRDYIITGNNDGSYRVSSWFDGLDIISGVELLRFSDQPIDLSTFTGLNQGESVFRFYNFQTGAHFYTANTTEAEKVLATQPEYFFEGVAFDNSRSGGGDAINVHRFYNTVTNTHFYTADPNEVAQVRATLPEYMYEGVAYQAHSTESAGTTELHRFYNTATNTRFYTADAQEAQNVKVELAGQYLYEGVAYYVDLA